MFVIKKYMHKSICDQYTPIPMMLGMTAVPWGLSALQANFYSSMHSIEITMNTMIGCAIGIGFAVGVEGYVVLKSINEERGRTWTSKMVQRGQLAAYFIGLVGALAWNAAVEYTDIENFDPENYERSVISIEQIEQNILYQQPQ